GGVAGRHAQHGQRQGLHDGGLAQYAQPVGRRHARVAAQTRQAGLHAYGGGPCHDAHRGQRDAPIGGGAGQAAQRHAQRGGDRQATDHDGERPRAEIRPHQRGRHRAGVGGVGGGRRRGDDAGGDQPWHRGGECRAEVGRAQQEQGADEQGAPRRRRGRGGNQRGQDGVGQREGGHRVAGHGGGDREVAGHHGEEGGHDECIGADGEGAEREDGDGAHAERGGGGRGMGLILDRKHPDLLRKKGNGGSRKRSARLGQLPAAQAFGCGGGRGAQQVGHGLRRQFAPPGGLGAMHGRRDAARPREFAGRGGGAGAALADLGAAEGWFGAFDGRDDFEQRDLLRRARQAEAALDAGAGGEDAGFHQQLQAFVQVGRRQLERRGQAGRRHRGVIASQPRQREATVQRPFDAFAHLPWFGPLNQDK